METTNAPYLNVIDPAFTQDPYPFMAKQLREAPCHWNPVFQAYAICSYEGCRQILKSQSGSCQRVDAMFSRLPPKVIADVQPTIDMLKGWALMVDGEQHVFLRSLLNAMFAPRLVAAMEADIRELVAESLSTLRSQKSIDLVSEVTGPLPANVLASMLDVPRDRMPWFKDCSDAITKIFMLSSRPEPSFAYRGQEALLELSDYIDTLLESRRQQPKDDIISVMLEHEHEGRKMSVEEIRSTLSLLLVAGHETTSNVLANGTYTLLKHPEQYLFLRDHPSHIPNAIEEMMRYESPVQITSRVLLNDLELEGLKIPAGQRAMVFLGAAHRDPSYIHEPDQFNILRPKFQHLAFGYGRHLCVGAHLARLEAKLFFEALLDLPGQCQLVDQPQWRSNPTLRALDSLNLRLMPEN